MGMTSSNHILMRKSYRLGFHLRFGHICYAKSGCYVVTIIFNPFKSSLNVLDYASS